MNKKEIALISGILLIAIVVWAFTSLPKKNGNYASVKKEDKEILVLDLNKNQIVPIDEHNCLEVSEGKIRMLSADCPNQICVNKGFVETTMDSIVCLPNQVVVTIQSKGESQVDGITN